MTIQKSGLKVLLVPTILFLHSCIQAQEESVLAINNIEQKTDSLIETALASEATPGVSIAVGVNGNTVLVKGYGKADIEEAKAANEQTVYGITSVTKQFTAAAILKLMEEDKLDLDESITKYLPEFPLQGQTVTIRQLLNHTSGTPSMKNTSSIKEDQWFSQNLSFQDMLEYFGKQPFEFEPGQKHSYNNFAYYLLGEIITRVSGMPWDQFMEKEFFEPWDLESFTTCDASSMPDPGAKTYILGKNGFVIAPTISKSVLGAAGALCASVEDLITWNHLLHGAKIISPASLELMLSPTVLNNGEVIDEGFGMYLENLGNKKRLSHGGALPWGAYLSYYPDTGLSIAVLTNSAKEGRKTAEDIEEALARIILGEKVKNITLALEDKEIYTGNYLLRLGDQVRNFKIYMENEKLMAQLQGQSAAEILYQGKQTFAFVVDPNIRLVFTVNQEKVEGVVLHQGGREIPGEKKH